MAFVKLDNPVELTDKILPVYLPDGRTSNPREQAITFGWIIAINLFVNLNKTKSNKSREK